MKRILVAGTPRSGTSWIAKALSLSGSVVYFREPDNPDRVEGADPWFRYLYLSSSMSEPRYERHIDRALSGEIVTHYTLAEQLPAPARWLLGGLRLAPSVERRLLSPLVEGKAGRLVKLIHGSLTLEWLAARHPDFRQVYVVRHPCGQFDSYARLGWEPRPERFLHCPQLVRDHLEPYLPVLRSARTFWERAGAQWGLVNRVVHNQSRSIPFQIRVPFEWVCADPVPRMRRLYEALELPWNRRVEAFLRRPRGGSGPYSFNRRSAAEIDKWKRRLPSRDIAQCRAFAEAFGVPLYEGFDPHNSSFNFK